MRHMLTAVLCLALAACGGAAGTPDELPAVRAVVLQSLALLAEGLQREDVALASQPAGERFFMGSNVALRYNSVDLGGTGIGLFRAYLAGVFAIHANISCQFELLDLQPADPAKQTSAVGDAVWATVKVTFNSLRVDSAPPLNFTSEATDYFVFEREGGAWLLERWDEVPPPPPHDEGGGGSV